MRGKHAEIIKTGNWGKGMSGKEKCNLISDFKPQRIVVLNVVAAL